MDRKRKPLLKTTGEAEFDGHIAILEEFMDTYTFEAVAFGQDGIGYGVAGMYVSDGGYDPYKSLLLKTEDGGRTWQPTGKRMNGRCSKMHLLDGSLYLLMHQDEPRMSAILKCDPQNSLRLQALAKFGTQTSVYGLHVLNDSTFACGMNFSKRGEDGRVSSSDSVMVTRDSGRTWEALSLPGLFLGYPNLLFDGTRAFVTLHDGIGGGFMFVKDIMTGEEIELPLPKHFGAAVVSGDLIATRPQITFWRHDREGLQWISAFGWNPRWGAYTPEYLHKQGDIVIGVGSQFPGRFFEKNCVFASVDGGKHWWNVRMSDDIHGATATIGASCCTGMRCDSVSVFYTVGSYSYAKHCVLTLKKKNDD